jgi:uncharacterized protein
MNCPVDGTPLLMAERQGIEIDYCPKCRGIWLDRGELDKLLERSAQVERGGYTSQSADQPGLSAGLPPMKRRLRRDDSQYSEQYPEKRKNQNYDDDDRTEQGSNNPLNRIGDFLGDIFDNF